MADTKKNYASGYDPAEDEEYRKALQALNSARKNKPVYANTYGPQAESLLDQMQNRKPFAYDINTDALYKQYRDQYQSLGRRAMEDTMGRARAMTGGYGNSYAQTAGQQSYQNHLGKLSQVVPTLYEQALERFYTPACISDIMKRGRECGFFVVYNHPTGSLENYSHYTNYHHMHAMEMYNGRCEYNPRVYDDMLRAGERIYCVGGDDNHNRPQLTSGSGYSWTMIKADKLEYRTIAQALLDGHFYASQGPEIHELWLEDGKLHVSCSDAVRIDFITANRRSRHFYAKKGETITQAEYAVNPDSEWVRVVVTDPQGKTASTNAYYLNE